ncbi:Phospholipase A(2) [Dirofilaria immitis]|nr:Phospholipase A(2) [Dirofilaria immitis]
MLFRTLILACLVASTYSALWNVFSMKKCVGGESLFHYNGYGCNCGLGQNNRVPVDDIDTCCLRHKSCYNRALESYDCKYWFLPYFTPYEWKCVDQNPVCSEEEAKSSNVCAAASCACDSEFVRCLDETEFSYPKPKCPSASHITKGNSHQQFHFEKE